MNPPFEAPLLDSALDRALRITNQRLGNIQLIDWKAGYLEIVAQQGFQRDFLDCFRRVTSSDSCACGRALLMRASIVINDVTQDDRFAPFRAVAASAGFRAVQSTPLISSSGALLGIISTHGNCSPESYQLEMVRRLAEETANELIRLRAGLVDKATRWSFDRRNSEGCLGGCATILPLSTQ